GLDSKGTGGGSGIRTHGTLSRTHAFQACALSHSAIPPAPLSCDGGQPVFQGRRGVRPPIGPIPAAGPRSSDKGPTLNPAAAQGNRKAAGRENFDDPFCIPL